MDETEDDLIKKLTNDLNFRDVEIKALSFQVSHLRLVNQSQCTQVADLQQENEQLNYELAEKEQDVLILQAKLNDITKFEDPNQSESYTINNLKGKLLSVANEKINELASELQSEVRRRKSVSFEYLDQINQLSAENSALRDELKNLSNHLAQRTVLYAAQERRMKESFRAHTTHASDLELEASNSRARLQDMEARYDKLERVRVNLLLQTRQLEDSKRQLDSQVEELESKIVDLNDEVAELTTQNVAMQSTIDHLRGLDIAALEKDLTGEAEALKRDFRTREEFLKRQIEELKKRNADSASSKEELMDEISLMRKENSELLHVWEQAKAQLMHQVITGDGLVSVESKQVVATSNDPVVVSSEMISEVPVGYGIDDSFAKSSNRNDLGVSPSFLLGNAESDLCQESAMRETFGSNEALEVAYSEIEELKNRERVLQKTLQKQSRKLALVLERAAELDVDLLSQKSPISAMTPEHELSTVRMLEEQLEHYRGEIQHLETAVVQARDLGHHEACMEFEATIRDLNSEIARVHNHNRSLESQLATLQASCSQETTPPLADAKHDRDEIIIQKMQSDMVQMQALMRSQEEDLEKQQTALHLLEAEISGYSKRNDALSRSEATLSEEVKSIRNQLKSAMDRQNELEIAAEDYISQLRQQEVVLATTKEEAQLLWKQVESLRQIRENQLEMEVNLDDQLTPRSTDSLAMEGNNSKHDGTTADLQSSLEILKTELAYHCHDLQQQEQIHVESAKQLKEFESKCIKQEEEIGLLRLEIQALKAERQQAEEQLHQAFRANISKLNDLHEANAGKLRRLSEAFQQLEIKCHHQELDLKEANEILEEIRLFANFEIIQTAKDQNDVLRLPEKLKSTLRELREQNEGFRLEIESLKGATNNDRTTADVVAAMTTKHEQELTALEENLKAQYNEALRRQQAQWESDRQEIVNWNRQLKSTISARWKTEMESLVKEVRAQHNNDIQTLKDEHSGELATIAEAHAKELAVSSAELQRVQNELDQSLSRISMISTALDSARAETELLRSNTADDPQKLRANVVELKEQFQRQFNEAKKKLKEKFKLASAKQAEKFLAEKDALVQMIRKEFTDMLAETTRQHQRHQAVTSKGVLLMNGDSGKELVIYPEMLSPEVTYELVRSIARRSQSEEEMREIFAKVRDDGEENSRNNEHGDTNASLRFSETSLDVSLFGKSRFK